MAETSTSGKTTHRGGGQINGTRQKLGCRSAARAVAIAAAQATSGATFKNDLRAQATAAVTAWIEKNGKKLTGRGEGLAEPVRVAEFWKTRQGESIRATLVTYEGRNCFDLRQYFTAPDGKMQPTRKGITIAVLRLPDLAAAVTKALARARELGLIEAEKTGGAA